MVETAEETAEESADLPQLHNRDAKITDDKRIAVAFFMITSFIKAERLDIWIIPRIWGIVKNQFHNIIKDKSGLHQVKENVAMISYAPLWRTMKQRGVSTYALISQYGFSRGTLDRLKQTRNVTTNTLDDLCRILDCEIWDVIEYIPDTKKD